MTKLSKQEKKVWQRHFHITTLSAIRKEMTGYSSIDGDADDDLMFCFAQRVSIERMYLKCTLITDEGVAHISKIRQLKDLTLRDHKKVTKTSIPYFNQMQNLERLNITLTKITLSDLCENLNNQNLKEVFISSEEDEHNSEEKGFILKERMPNCNIYLNCTESTDAFSNPETPIF